MVAKRILEVEDLRVGIKRHEQVLRILDGVSFHINEGETLGIVGESGCGKSTTGLAMLNLLPKSVRPFTQGKVNFLGSNVLQMNSKELQQLRGRDISMVLQDPMTSLNPVLTIGDQIGEVILSHGLARAETIKSKVIDALRHVRIPAPETRAHAYPHQLSGGMRQRVVGAVAIACRPKLLIADEPTTALDVTIQAQYLQLLKTLQKELNMALMFVTHDFGVVARMCDRVCVMYAGQVVETAPVSNIFHCPAHWYTAALIGSLPKLWQKANRLTAISGSPPPLQAEYQGCRFSSRCKNVQPRCRIEAPMPVAIGEDHQIRCWYPRTENPLARKCS